MKEFAGRNAHPLRISAELKRQRLEFVDIRDSHLLCVLIQPSKRGGLNRTVALICVRQNCANVALHFMQQETMFEQGRSRVQMHTVLHAAPKMPLIRLKALDPVKPG